MPYVEVWVDDEPCDGTCSSGKSLDELEAKLHRAIEILRDGDAEGALYVLSEESLPGRSDPKRMAAAYAEWKRGKLPGFHPPPSPSDA